MVLLVTGTADAFTFAELALAAAAVAACLGTVRATLVFPIRRTISRRKAMRKHDLRTGLEGHVALAGRVRNAGPGCRVGDWSERGAAANKKLPARQQLILTPPPAVLSSR